MGLKGGPSGRVRSRSSVSVLTPSRAAAARVSKFSGCGVPTGTGFELTAGMLATGGARGSIHWKPKRHFLFRWNACISALSCIGLIPRSRGSDWPRRATWLRIAHTRRRCGGHGRRGRFTRTGSASSPRPKPSGMPCGNRAGRSGNGCSVPLPLSSLQRHHESEHVLARRMQGLLKR